jgi:hypothetical protein
MCEQANIRLEAVGCRLNIVKMKIQTSYYRVYSLRQAEYILQFIACTKIETLGF